MDFIFDLGKSPPYFVLAFSFQNTALLNKATKKWPVMFRPVLICHRKYENEVKLLCDTLLDACPGLEENIKVLGADRENIINQTCNVLPYAMLLVCVKHIKENIKRNLPKNITETKKKEILVYIFGNDTKKGLIESETIEEYENKLKECYEILSVDKELTVFF